MNEEKSDRHLGFGSIVELCAADVIEIVEEPWVGGGLAHCPPQLLGSDPWIALFDVGEDVGHGSSIIRVGR